jgi:putative hemolysin
MSVDRENLIVPENEKFINLEKAIASKNPKLLKFMPGFVLRYIKKIVHQEELNKAIYLARHRHGVDFANAAYEEFGVKFKIIGEENIVKTGGVIMAANHPLGGLDGLTLIKIVSDYRPDIRFFVNDLLMAFKNYAPIFVPVNKHGKNSSDYARKFEEVYAGTECLLIFPAGLVSRRNDKGVVEDLVWKKSFIAKAIQYKKNIVPVYIEGNNSKRFYNLAYYRKKLGIKANIEMFYLVDEMYRQRGKTLTFIFGEQISWETFTSDHPAEYWSAKVKEHVYALKSGDKSKLLPTIKNNHK